MPIVLYRVDERLIHGQVVVGWGNQLHPHRYVVVDDELAGSVWEQELYALGLPPEVDAAFTTVAEAGVLLPQWRAAAPRVIVLTRNLASMRRLGESGELRGQHVNLGGIHYAAGRRSFLPYLYLSDAELSDVQRLVDDGAIVSARDLPGTRRVAADALLSQDANGS